MRVICSTPPSLSQASPIRHPRAVSDQPGRLPTLASTRADISPGCPQAGLLSLCEAAALAIRVSLQVRRRPLLSAPDTVSCQVVRSVAERVSYGTYEVGESLLPPRRGLDPV
jgi:hypothetical protein